METMQNWDERSLRRAFIHMQDAGQARAFFVKFTGEGVDDQGGPYRAVFQTSVGEESIGLLELLLPCSNSKIQVGDNRDKYVFNTSLTCNPLYSNVFIHFGKMIAMAARHNILVPLSLPKLIWKPLVGEVVGYNDLQAIDTTVTNSLRAITAGEMADDIEQLHELLVHALTNCSNYLLPTVMLSQNLVKSIVSHTLSFHKQTLSATDSVNNNNNNLEAKNSLVNKNNALTSLVELIEHLHLISQSEGLKLLYRGLSSIIPIEMLPFFTSEELESIFCGESEVDIEILKKATVYESVSSTDRYVIFFLTSC
jgi:hypothetical protein